MRKTGILIVGWVVLALSSGCKTTSSGFGLTVSNNSDEKVKDVEVVLDGKIAYRVRQLKPREIMDAPIAIREAGPKESLVRWKTESGDVVEKLFKPEKPLPRRFTGRLDMEFKSALEVAMYSDLEENREGSLIPWARPEEWEGAPTIPGFSGQR